MVAGLSISYALEIMTAIAWLLLLGSMVESQMTSVERVLTYTKLPSDPAYGVHSNSFIPDDWPRNGAIEFRDMSLCYYPGSPKVSKRIIIIIIIIIINIIIIIIIIIVITTIIIIIIIIIIMIMMIMMMMIVTIMIILIKTTISRV